MVTGASSTFRIFTLDVFTWLHRSRNHFPLLHNDESVWGRGELVESMASNWPGIH